MIKKLFIISALILSLFTCCASADYEVGEIKIPCIDIVMPIYESDYDTTESRQAVIDNEQSALYSNWLTAYKIGDHVFSVGKDDKGEWNIQKIFPGAYAFLTKDGTTYYYECYMAGKTEYDGNEYINGKLITPDSSLDLMLTCCAEDSSHHFIAIFRRLCEF